MKQMTFLLIMVSVQNIGLAQNRISDSNVESFLQIKSQAASDSVMIRWAMNNAICWKKSLKYGFNIYRKTVFRNGDYLRNEKFERLNQHPIIPITKNKWKLKVNDSPMAAVVAQAIYGEDFILEDDEINISQIFSKAEELNRRFGFALFAIDQDFNIALLAGLGFVDRQVKADEQYIYKVFSAMPETDLAYPEPALAFVNLSKTTELPAPSGLIAYRLGNKGMIQWNNSKEFSELYSSYFIERSVDGKIFYRVSEVPFAQTDSQLNKTLKFTDILQDSSKTYHYRIIGKTIFNSIGKPSSMVKLKEVNRTKVYPDLLEPIIWKDSVRLNWKYYIRKTDSIIKFQILSSATPTGAFLIKIDSIASEQRRLDYRNQYSVEYIKVRVLLSQNEYVDSNTRLIQIADTIPPQIPKNLKIILKTNRIVNLKWNLVADPDILGYDIYRAKKDGDIKTKLNVSPIKIDTFNDSLLKGDFISKYRYYIKAIDRKFNESDFSKEVVVDFPDIIKPTSPLINKYQVNKDCIILSWVNSSSNDVQSIQLFRSIVKEGQKGDTVLIKNLPVDFKLPFKDEKLKGANEYYYFLKAIDSSGNISSPSPGISVKIAPQFQREALKFFKATPDFKFKLIDLSWDANRNGLISIALYRKVGDGKLSLYKRIPYNQNHFTDRDIVINSNYEYMLRLIYNDGSQSFSNKIQVNY
ncbi:fibronectin type III domain-containing protein [Robertkochia solimangrovi]|uniref:fibronectin type III domain-containing protein n=1 Tax=Robertkochia solimangrovi TaxID=2213046 RepID=UPI00117DDF63|nr:fibronectin type III domain-containing protein [Robertkochia solimangrovi]TRZ42839.1 hypothetical protein DMZ48_12275 [Robertkochia solimangrovi]